MEYAILHKQLCDNFSKCPAMLACEETSKQYGRSPAIYLDEDGHIDINRKNCIGCASCIERCGLFRIVSSLYKELEFQKEFDEDPRNRMKLSVERFGCDIINKKDYLLQELSEVKEYIENSSNDVINILEFVDKNHVMCPFQAVEVDYIISQFSCIGEYRKLVIEPDDIEMFEKIKDNFSIVQFPAILLINSGKVIGEPILTEFRIEDEKDRMNIQLFLEKSLKKIIDESEIVNGTY